MDLQLVIIIIMTRHIPYHILSRKLFRFSPKMARLANSFRRHNFSGTYMLRHGASNRADPPKGLNTGL